MIVYKCIKVCKMFKLYRTHYYEFKQFLQLMIIMNLRCEHALWNYNPKRNISGFFRESRDILGSYLGIYKITVGNAGMFIYINIPRVAQQQSVMPMSLLVIFSFPTFSRFASTCLNIVYQLSLLSCCLVMGIMRLYK